MSGRVIAGLATTCVVGVAALTLLGPAPIAPGRGPQHLAVTSAEVICPPIPAGKAVSGYLAAAIPPGTSGSLAVRSHGSNVESLAAGTSALFGARNVGAGASVATVTGTAAAAFGLANSVTVPGGPSRRWLLRPCAPSNPDTWFIGGASVLGRQTTIELVNPDPTASQVDVNLFGPNGPIAAPSGHGIVVPGFATTTVSLTALAPDVPLLAANVWSVAGRVSATAYDIATDGLKSLGATSLPPTQSGVRLLLPAVPAGVTKATLQVLTQASGGATVQVRLLTSDGRFTPVGGGLVNLVANQVVALDLTQGLAGQAAAILVTSSSPVVAGVRFATTGAAKVNLVGELVPAIGLASSAILSGILGSASVEVFLAATGSGGQVSLSVWGPGLAPIPVRQVLVPPDRQVVVHLPALSGWWSLLVAPVSGSAVSATALALYPGPLGPLLAAVPLAGLPNELNLPAAQLDLGLASR